jgi:sortase A
MKKLIALTLMLMVCMACAVPASAEEYTFDPPDDYLFGTPTSTEEVHTGEEPENTDRSKSVALIPPGFGSPTSYLPGSGEYLTPNLVPGALDGGLVEQVGEVNYPAVSTTDVTGMTPGDATFSYTTAPSTSIGTGYTAVTNDLYYDGGYLATLKIPAIGVNVKVFEGTDGNTLAKGAGHFANTSIWNGNCCIAGHNRGANCYFGRIHELSVGDTITLTTKLGTRTYAVTSVKKIAETDSSDTAATSENCITLFTCVRDQSAYRWCVRAVAQG